MAYKTTRSKTAQSVSIISNEGSPAAQANGQTTLDVVEKTLLGAAPNDLLAVTGRRSNLAQDPMAARIDSVRTFLEGQPELRAALEQEIDKAWQRADGQRGVFLDAFAERRAQVLSAAELGSRRQAPEAAAEFQDELTRYLTAMEGFNG